MMINRLKQLAIASILVVSACGQNEPTTQSTDPKTEESVVKIEDKVENAIVFINAYVENSNKMGQAVGMVEWVQASDLATKSFKEELKRIVDEAFKQDPELGLDADPILDAQDYPSLGFKFDSFDEKTNYLLVKGIDSPEFKLTMKLVEENGNWIVDGCGIINIPQNKRSER